jgi:hypothetical protein
MATEDMVQVWDWGIIDEVLLMSGVEAPAQIPLLDNHNRTTNDDVLGSVRNIRSLGAELHGTCHFAADERPTRTFAKIRDGHITDVSVGYEQLDFVDIPAGASADVGGVTYQAKSNPLRVTTRWRLMELSICPIGADPSAKVRAMKRRYTVTRSHSLLGGVGDAVLLDEQDAASFLKSGHLKLARKKKRMTEEEREDEEAREDEEREDEEREDEESREDEDVEDEEASEDEEAREDDEEAREDEEREEEDREDEERSRGRSRSAVLSERKRVQAIRRMASNDIPASMINDAIASGVSAARAGQMFLRHIRQGRGPAIHVRNDSPADRTAALAAGMMVRCGVKLDKLIGRKPSHLAPAGAIKIDERAADAAGRFSQMSLLDVCRAALAMAGHHVPHDRGDCVRAAMVMAQDAEKARIVGRATSTADVGTIFTTSINAVLEQAYQETADSTVGWVREGQANNYQTQELHTFGKTATPKKLIRSNEAKHATFGADYETYKVHRYAVQFELDEQDIIDDNLSVLNMAPMEIGMAAARVRPDLVYGLLLRNPSLRSGTALFHANHGNLLTTGSVLSAANLQAAIVAMAKQTKDDVNLNIAPAFLIVPQDLRFTADIILSSAERIIAASSDGTYNPLQNIVQVRADNRIGVAGVTDPDTETAQAGTATNYFLFANPTQAPVVHVGYLAGSSQSPQLRTFVLDRGRWGMGYDVKLDIGVGVVDYRGALKATGAS